MKDKSTIKKLLGQRIQALRKYNKFTQEELAEKIGIGTPNISYFETGKFAPSLETLEKLAKALNVEMYEFYMFKPYKSTEDIRKELVEVINSDENILRLLYKFYLAIK